MKSLYNISLLFFLIFMLIGCNKTDNEENVPYYTFNDLDYELLIKYNYSPNQILVYKNQFDEELNFKVISNETKKLGYYSRGTFSGGGGWLVNYYDSKIIRIEILENPYISDWDGDFSKVNYIFSKNHDTFANGINFPMWNVSSFSSIDEIQHSANIIMTEYNDIPKFQMNINGHLFTNVISIESGSNEVSNISSFGPLMQNVNQIYYDYNFGVIQFNDVDGKEWKVIYPE